MPQISFHPGHDPDDSDPTWARGRQLVRETITAALFNVDDVMGYGLAPATLEALRDPDLLVAFLVELRVWAELATRIAAEAQGITTERTSRTKEVRREMPDEQYSMLDYPPGPRDEPATYAFLWKYVEEGNIKPLKRMHNGCRVFKSTRNEAW